MKAPSFEYFAAKDLAEVLRLLSEDVDTRILAGGQSLMAMLNMRFAFPERLIDINGIKELSYIRENNEVIEIGAMTRQREVEFSELIKEHLPLLHEAILNVGHRQTRNRGTVGGSLCQLDPSAEIPTVALALDATVLIQSQNKSHEMAVSDYLLGYMSPALEDGEMLVGIKIKPWPKNHGYSFIEFSRRHGDFAIVSVAVALLLDVNKKVSRLSITLGGVGPTACRMPEAEQFLLNKEATTEQIKETAEICAKVEAASDTYVPGWYRQRLTKVLVERALRQAISRFGESDE